MGLEVASFWQTTVTKFLTGKIYRCPRFQICSFAPKFPRIAEMGDFQPQVVHFSKKIFRQEQNFLGEGEIASLQPVTSPLDRTCTVRTALMPENCCITARAQAMKSGWRSSGSLNNCLTVTGPAPLSPPGVAGNDLPSSFISSISAVTSVVRM